MSETLYFQWQNEVLLKTIYPLREKKLRDFLLYFAEIDIWKEYKDKTPAGLADEIRLYHEGQAKLIRDAYESYASLRDYFLKPDVREEYATMFNPVDEAELAKINKLHANFALYLPNSLKKGGGKYMVTSQESTWVEHRQEHRRLIVSKKRRIDAIVPNHPKRPIEIQELEMMEKVALPMAETELAKLRAFIKAIEKIEPRQLELTKSQAASIRQKDSLERKLPFSRDNLAKQESSYNMLKGELIRLKNPPDMASAKDWFSAPDIAAQLRERYPQAGDTLVNTVKGLRKAMLEEYGNINNPSIKLLSLKNFRQKWSTSLKGLERELETLQGNLSTLPADHPDRAQREQRFNQLKDADTKVLADEIERLNDFYAAVEFSSKPANEVQKTIEAKEQELAKAGQTLSALKQEVETMQAELVKIDAILNADDRAYLTAYIPSETVTAKNIAMLKTEQLSNELNQKNHYELLEAIVKKFIENPQRYPLWLQYMTIHFSGMRYKSAHGSWADPRDFLVRWHRLRSEKEFGNPDDVTVEKLCKEKVAQYQTPAAPRLARAAERNWQIKRDNNLRGMSTGGPKTRRAALIAILADEVQYDFMQMSEQEALDAIVAMKSQLPGWMWKELLALTNLKVNLVTDPGWEKLTPAEEAEKGSYSNSELRMMFNKWKEDHTTGWREEHERTHRLIVTRAVCNETAEHCQHLRGHNPPGGLTAKAPWYQKLEKENKIPGNPRPYFVKPKTLADFTVGASILWLRFVQEEISPWRVARPLATVRDGDTLIANELRGRGGSWSYQESDMVTRKRSITDENKQRKNEEQWLRWIHEATVAEVGDTAEGPVVLTYETALPDDDPGLSAIGLFQLSQHYALSDGSEDNYNRSFVGFVPEGQLPVEHLEEMLDWNHILRREVLPSAEMQAWRKKNIRRE